MNSPEVAKIVSDEALLALRVGGAIRALREKAGLSTRQLAVQSGISQPFLSQLERGVSAPSMVTTYRIAEALGVLPGALLPSPHTALVTVVRADEGTMLQVANRPDAAQGRALFTQTNSMLEVIEYQVEPGQYLAEWFQSDGELAMYVVEGQVDIEIEGVGTHRLGPRDLLVQPGSLRHRWLLVDNRAAHILLTIARPTTKS